MPRDSGGITEFLTHCFATGEFSEPTSGYMSIIARAPGTSDCTSIPGEWRPAHFSNEIGNEKGHAARDRHARTSPAMPSQRAAGAPYGASRRLHTMRTCERGSECSPVSMIEEGRPSIDPQRRAMMTGRERRAADRYRASGRYPLLVRRVESRNFKEKKSPWTSSRTCWPTSCTSWVGSSDRPHPQGAARPCPGTGGAFVSAGYFSSSCRDVSGSVR